LRHEQPALSVRAQITSRESQSAFNVPGAIEFILEIQSTNDQPFVLQGMSINRGRCGYYTADFHSKMPVQMTYSSTVSYLLKCRGDQVLEAELITDQGNVSLSFDVSKYEIENIVFAMFSIKNPIFINLFDFWNRLHLYQSYAYRLNPSLEDVVVLFLHSPDKEQRN